MEIRNANLEFLGQQGYKVEGDPTAKEITVAWDATAILEKVKSTLKEIN